MINILFLDDVKLITLLIEEMLATRNDCAVTTFCSPNKALIQMAKHDFDVIISDFHMPEMDGVTFLKESRLLQPDAIRIMMTMSDDKEVINDSIHQAQAHHYLQKPIDKGMLNTVIDDCILQIRNKSD